MSETPGDEKPRPDADSPFMDLDLDLDVSSWPFDPSASAFVSNPPSPFLLLSSSPPQSLLHLPFPSPPSPLWVFEDRIAEVSSSLVDCPKFLSCFSDTTNGNIDKDDGKTWPLQMSVVEKSSDDSCTIKERMAQALRYLKESTDQHLLVQVWAPVKSGDRYVLTTSGQPFVLDPQSSGLLHYRTASLMYMFSVDEDGDGDLGLPGRVYRQKLPEWTPNVQYYSSKEYPRLDHALHYNVRGTLALPVFEPSGQSCVGVVELIMTSQKINYAPEVDKVCKALEAVNLKSSEILDHPVVQICNEGRQAALAEILEILTLVCEGHKLPLAQTWVPCRHRSVLAHGGGSKKSCSSFDGSCMGQVCMSTTDVAFYVIDPHIWGFRHACAEHHLQKGQGVVGRAFASCRPCFSRDITQFCKTEYPLVHYARMFELASCLAICLQSTHTGSDQYILEFFLPPDCKDTNNQQVLLDSILTMVKKRFRSLKVTADVELHEGISLEVIDMLATEDHELEPKRICSQSCETHSHASPETILPEGVDDSLHEGNVIPDMLEQNLSTDADVEKNDNILIDSNGIETSSSLLGNKNNRTLERRRGKAEKSISLEVLQQYFAGSLKDAAKSLGVCPTTMKRICRQHGISRWPSRKINKVNRSLSKLKRVIESVQGAAGAFKLSSISCPLPVAVSSISWPVNLDVPKQCDGAKPFNLHGEGDKVSSPHKTPESDDRCNKLVSQQELVHDQTSSQPEPGEDSHCSKKSSSGEGSIDSPTSHGSCQGSPANETHLGNPFISNLEQGVNISNSLGFTLQNIGDQNLSALFSIPDAIIAEPQPLLCGMLIEDSGSSKDLKNLCNSVGEGGQNENAMSTIPNSSQPVPMQDPRTVTIKAGYKEDIIRFRLPCGAGVVALNEEVAKRLKLEVGTFDIRYLDDDHEWVMLACDADLEECIEISRLSGGHVIRLSVHDILTSLGSSCESSGG